MGREIHMKGYANVLVSKQTKNEKQELDGGYIHSLFEYSCGCHSDYLQDKDKKIIFDHTWFCDTHKKVKL